MRGTVYGGKAQERKTGRMPLYMDHHKNVDGLTAQAVEQAHQKDLEVQDEHGAKYHSYWYNEDKGEIFCLVEAPSEEAAEAVHREAHGLTADEITEVKKGS
jgi:Protein of unknown function (DUF4242)